MFTRKTEQEIEVPTLTEKMPEEQKLPSIEPKKILPLKSATEIADNLGQGDSRLIYIVYGVATGYRNTENAGLIAPRFGGVFEVCTPDKRAVYKSKYCFLPEGVQGLLVEKLKELGSVELVIKINLVRNDHKFMRFEYKAEIETLKEADPLTAIREHAKGVA